MPLPTINGQRVTQRCAPGLSDGFVELLMVVTFDRRGGKIDAMRVDYTAKGKPYTLLIAWSLVGCGRGLEDQEDLENCAEWD